MEVVWVIIYGTWPNLTRMVYVSPVGYYIWCMTKFDEDGLWKSCGLYIMQGEVI